MLRVTADTNIYISSFIFAGTPRKFIQAAEDGKFHLAISEPLINELSRVLSVKFHWSGKAVAETLALITTCASLVHPIHKIDAVPGDPDDNRVLECAVESGSNYIVTGDKDLLRLKNFEDISIVGVADFLKLLPRSNEP